MKPVRIERGQIPDGVEVEDYPEGTLFVLNEKRLRRDPYTFELIKPEPMKKTWPEDVRRMMADNE